MSKQKVNKLQAGSIARVPIASDGVLERASIPTGPCGKERISVLVIQIR